MEFKVGDTHSLFKGPGRPYKIHICAIIDDFMVAYKWYGRRKQWWHYDMVSMEALAHDIKRTEDRLRAEQQASRPYRCLLRA